MDQACSTKGDINIGKLDKNYEKTCSVHLKIPFESDKFAEITYNSINADQVPNPEVIERLIKVEKNTVEVTIKSKDLFKLRTSLNNFIEAVLQIQKTIDTFRPPEIETQQK